MTIEMTSTASPPAKAATGAQGSKASKGASDAAQSTGASGFMAILDALGDGAPQDATSVLPAVTQAQDPDAKLPNGLPFDAAALLQQNPQIALAQAALRAVDGKGTEGDATLAVPDAASKTGGSAAQAAGRALALAADGKLAPDAQLAGDAPTLGLQRAHAHASKAAKEKAGLGANDSAGLTQATAVVAERVELRDSKLLAAIEQARASVVARAAEPAVMVSMASADKPTSERMAQAARGIEPTYAGGVLDVASPEFSLEVAPTAVVPETQVAEQVTYWVSQNVQNAELQLEGLGLSPVEVSISVQGNEAQISFRTDEAQARGVLEGAGAQLKDMLQREGVLLTGVSVGTSGSGDPAGSGGERRGRSHQRQVSIAATDAPAQPAARRMGQEAGRSVDLFV